MPNLVPQAAVIPVRADGCVCLITSRSRPRWVLPKGRIEFRQTARQAGLVEAWEEAGLRGDVLGESVGTYRYEKRGKPHHVTVFVMRVDAIADEYPEMGERQRVWVRPEVALDRVEEHELKAILKTVFAPSVT
jgi:8-oxo-dGTP pyrophosphatase MutT (NUDIX family)